jgi:hypothetical protein
MPRWPCAAMAACRDGGVPRWPRWRPRRDGRDGGVPRSCCDFGSANRTGAPPRFTPPPFRGAPAPPTPPRAPSLFRPPPPPPPSAGDTSALSSHSHAAASSRRPHPPLVSTRCGPPGSAAGAGMRDESGRSWRHGSFPTTEVYQNRRGLFMGFGRMIRKPPLSGTIPIKIRAGKNSRAHVLDFSWHDET